MKSFEPQDAHDLIWGVCWYGIKRGFFVALGFYMLITYVFLRNLLILPKLPHYEGYFFLFLGIPVSGSLLGGIIGLVLGFLTYILPRGKFFKWGMSGVAGISSFALSATYFLEYMRLLTVVEPIQLSFGLHVTLIASASGTLFGYEVAVWRQRYKKKKKLSSEGG